MIWPIDRIDRKGNIREHYYTVTETTRRTLCGLAIEQAQAPAGNALCRRCEKLGGPCQSPRPCVCQLCTERTAREHAEGDKACGRDWTCQCGACRIVRGGTKPVPHAKETP